MSRQFFFPTRRKGFQGHNFLWGVGGGEKWVYVWTLFFLERVKVISIYPLCLYLEVLGDPRKNIS